MRKRWPRCSAFVLFACVIAMVTGDPEALALGMPAETLARPWHVSRAHSGEKVGVWIAVTNGYCYGEGKPHIAHIKVVERGVAGGHRQGRAIITVFGHYPAIGNAEGECRDIGLTLERFIRLRRPVARLSLYDGSLTPPRLVIRRSDG